MNFTHQSVLFFCFDNFLAAIILNRQNKHTLAISATKECLLFNVRNDHLLH